MRTMTLTRSTNKKRTTKTFGRPLTESCDAWLLSRVDGAHRAGVGAGAAVDAGVRINHIMNITLVDGALRALARACSAGHAII